MSSSPPGGCEASPKYHEAHPFRFADQEVRYEPGEAEVKIMGGNSNWRGPVWFPTTFLLIESLRTLGKAYGPGFTVPAQRPIGTAGDPRAGSRGAGEPSDPHFHP